MFLLYFPFLGLLLWVVFLVSFVLEFLLLHNICLSHLSFFQYLSISFLLQFLQLILEFCLYFYLSFFFLFSVLLFFPGFYNVLSVFGFSLLFSAKVLTSLSSVFFCMFLLGTLNVRGCHSNHKLETLIQDFRKYKLDIIGITETHIPVSEELIESSEYTIFTVNKEKNIHHGVGIAVKKDLNPNFIKLRSHM